MPSSEQINAGCKWSSVNTSRQVTYRNTISYLLRPSIYCNNNRLKKLIWISWKMNVLKRRTTLNTDSNLTFNWNELIYLQDKSFRWRYRFYLHMSLLLYFFLFGLWGYYHSSRRWLWRSRWNVDWQGKPKFSEKTCPSATFVHHKIPHDQTRVWTQAAAVGSRRLTAWAMARPVYLFNFGQWIWTNLKL
jgi:hypothetical protein